MSRFSHKGIRFSGDSIKSCICFIDVIDSTKNTLKFSDLKDTRKYYSTFINSINEIVKKYNAKIIKNIGDSLLFYFPDTADTMKISRFVKALECGLEILENRQNVNDKVAAENFPPFNYRISMDYGVVEIALSGEYNQLDIFGSAVNLCAKINILSNPNELVIGDNLYRILKAYSPIVEKHYLFNFSKDFTVLNGCATCSQKDVCKLFRVSGEYMTLEDTKYSCYILKRKYPKKLSHKNQYISKLNNTRGPQFSVLAGQRDQVEYEKEYRDYNNIKKIILVDDDPEVLYTFKSFLTEFKYNVNSFTDYEQALQYMRSNPFYDNLLIITDIVLKKLNGLQFYLQAKTIDPTIKFLFITAYDIVDEVISVIPGLNKSDIIRKPIEKNRFVNKVNSLLPI
ncbi:MAG TPA: response regulator [Nitrososphaeraceae archaeon]|nr:response regulator [Nitrososphaeraceae archaeon]